MTVDENAPKIEEINDTDSDDSDSPELEQGDGSKTADGKVQNRAEKKMRKAISKMGLKPVPGITRVTVKKSKSVLFVLQKPDVLKSPNGDTYVVFGEAKFENMAEQAQQQVAQLQAMHAQKALLEQQAAGQSGGASTEEKPAEGDAAKGNDAKENDIDLVVAQAGCSREKAKEALEKNNNDLVEAIMALQS